MIDLAEALADQEDLEALCAPRSVPETSIEVYWPNADYGFAKILKTYARYPLERPVMAMIPHGVSFQEEYVHESDARAPVRAVLSFPGFRDAAWECATDKRVIPSASPFLYALDLAGEAAATERTGTLFAPYHSTAAVEAVFDWERLIAELGALPAECHPVTVCMYWQDVLDGRHRILADAGLSVVSAGYFLDQDFVFRLIHLLSQHRFAASNGPGSQLFYALAAGLPYFFVGDMPQERVASDGAGLETYMQTEDGWDRMHEIRSMFSEIRGDITPEQQELADYYLGKERFKTPEKLNWDLRTCESFMWGRR